MNNFYWIDSIDSFCTPETHNPLLPNRQNEFCNQRSVMEVMENCLDWTQVSEPVVFAEPAFKIVRPSDKPLVYFLLDTRIMPVNTYSKELFQIFIYFKLSSLKLK